MEFIPIEYQYEAGLACYIAIIDAVYEYIASITYTSTFKNGIEMDISLCFVDEGKPYVQAVLFKDGTEIACCKERN